jgi:hypothetical protein
VPRCTPEGLTLLPHKLSTESVTATGKLTRFQVPSSSILTFKFRPGRGR